MKTIKKITVMCVALSVATIFLTSCSKEKKYKKRLNGSWDVSSYEGDGTADDGGTGKTSSTKDVNISATNAGKYTFNDDGTGSCNLNYQMEMTESDGTKIMVMVNKSEEFTWNNGDNSVSIIYNNGGKDEFSVKVNEKEKQDWKGKSSGQTLTSGINVDINLFDDDLTLDMNLEMVLTRK